MKIYTVVFHNDDGDSFAIGAFSTFDLAEQECDQFVESFDGTECDRETGVDETRIYFENDDGEPFGFADISTLTLDEFTY